MEYPGFPYPKNTQSYPTQQVVWKYLDSFAEHFHLKNKIKYLRAVENVVPVDNNKWRITVRCLRNDTIETGTFDAVFVCSGATSSPKFPRLPGLKNFRGTFLHSRSYRKAEKFRGLLFNFRKTQLLFKRSKLDRTSMSVFPIEFRYTSGFKILLIFAEA